MVGKGLIGADTEEQEEEEAAGPSTRKVRSQIAAPAASAGGVAGESPRSAFVAPPPVSLRASAGNGDEGSGNALAHVRLARQCLAGAAATDAATQEAPEQPPKRQKIVPMPPQPPPVDPPGWGYWSGTSNVPTPPLRSPADPPGWGDWSRTSNAEEAMVAVSGGTQLPSRAPAAAAGMPCGARMPGGTYVPTAALTASGMPNACRAMGTAAADADQQPEDPLTTTPETSAQLKARLMGMILARDQAVRERDQAIRERNHVTEERDLAMRKHGEVSRERDDAVEHVAELEQEIYTLRRQRKRAQGVSRGPYAAAAASAHGLSPATAAPACPAP